MSLVPCGSFDVEVIHPVVIVLIAHRLEQRLDVALEGADALLATASAAARHEEVVHVARRVLDQLRQVGREQAGRVGLGERQIMRQEDVALAAGPALAQRKGLIKGSETVKSPAGCRR